MQNDTEKAVVQPAETPTPVAQKVTHSDTTNQKKGRKRISETLNLQADQMWGIFGELVGKMTMYELMTLAQMHRMLTSRSGAKAIDVQGMRIIDAYLNEGAVAEKIIKETHLFKHRMNKARLFAKSHDAIIPALHRDRITDYLCNRAQDVDEIEAHFKKIRSTESNSKQ